MPMSKPPKEVTSMLTRQGDEPTVGFDVTVETVIGRVMYGIGDENATVAAFKLIAEHEAQMDRAFPRTYRLPDPGGATIVVTVEHEGPR